MGDINVKSMTQKIVVEPGTSVVRIINAGPPGPPGFSSGGGGTGDVTQAELDSAVALLDARIDAVEATAGVLTKTAASTLSGHRVVYLKSDGVSCDYASNQTPSHMRLSVGLTLNASTVGEPISIATSGEVTEPTWSWTPGSVLYLGVNGVLTSVAPTAPAFLRVIAAVITATTIFVNPESPIALL